MWGGWWFFAFAWGWFSCFADFIELYNIDFLVLCPKFVGVVWIVLRVVLGLEVWCFSGLILWWLGYFRFCGCMFDCLLGLGLRC